MDKRIFTERGSWLGFALLLFVLVDTWVLGRFYLALQGLTIDWRHAEWFALIFAVHMAGVSLPALNKEDESQAFAWIIGIMNLAAMCYFFEWLPSNAFELQADGSKRFLSTAEKWSDWLPKALASGVWAIFVGYGYLQLPTAFTQALRTHKQTADQDYQENTWNSFTFPGIPQSLPISLPHSPSFTRQLPTAPDWADDSAWSKLGKKLTQDLTEKLCGMTEQQAKDRRRYLRKKMRGGTLNGEKAELDVLEKIF